MANDPKKAKKDEQIERQVEKRSLILAIELSYRAPKTFKRIPVFICDSHNEVLDFILRSVGAKYMLERGNVLVHFDSHPDLGMPEISGNSCYDKEALLSKLSIEDWIAPCLFTGIFNKVIWLKNKWCEQIPVGKYEFRIGQEIDGGKLNVDLATEYYFEDGFGCPTEKLNKPQKIVLNVCNVDTVQPDKTYFAGELLNENYILDIDLDYFSTADPFLNQFEKVNWRKYFKVILDFKIVKQSGSEEQDCYATAAKRRKQLNEIRKIFEYLQEQQQSLKGLDEHVQYDKTIANEAVMNAIKQLVTDVKQVYVDNDFDWNLLFTCGSIADGLPHHVSNETELAEYFECFKQCLQRLPTPPLAVTMAQSVYDDYCPREQLELIQTTVCKLLRDVFGERMHETPIAYYEGAEYNLRDL